MADVGEALLTPRVTHCHTYMCIALDLCDQTKLPVPLWYICHMADAIEKDISLRPMCAMCDAYCI